MITASKIPSKSWVVFQYEEALDYFRIFYFYHDMSVAPSDYFYYKPGCSKDRDYCMHVNRFFVHHKMMNTVPAYPVLIRSSSRNRKWFVRMDEIDNELYITTGWNRIKQEMSITENHLVVFEMFDIHTFEMRVFSCEPALLSCPPELCFIKQEPPFEIIEISDDETGNHFPDFNAEHNEADGVPITFRVDNHYRLPKQWAEDHGLRRKMALTINDTVGGVWEVKIGVEMSQVCPRYHVTGMGKFVRDKQMAFGEEFEFLYVKSKDMLVFN